MEIQNAGYKSISFNVTCIKTSSRVGIAQPVKLMVMGWLVEVQQSFFYP
jgi:hypothetical protein